MKKKIIYKGSFLWTKELNLFSFTDNHSFLFKLIWKLNQKLIQTGHLVKYHINAVPSKFFQWSLESGIIKHKGGHLYNRILNVFIIKEPQLSDLK